jgi:Cutinase
MKFTAFLTLVAASASALAAPISEVQSRQVSCQSVHVLFARGTTEPGTLGTVVGPRLAVEVPRSVRGTAEVEGIPYPANVAGFLAGGDRGGARTMTTRIREIAAGCPNTKIFISGYSYVFFTPPFQWVWPLELILFQARRPGDPPRCGTVKQCRNSAYQRRDHVWRP